MEKEDIRIYLQGHLGLGPEHLTIEFLEQDQLRLQYDIRAYDMPETETLHSFLNKLKSLPSAAVARDESETGELRLRRSEVEELLQRLDPPIQA